jgi:DNA polymerase elongation subunit (family B)
MTLEFQIYDYVEDHENIETDSDQKYKPLGDYIIHVFGRTMDDKSVYAKVTGFTPYFYIELPSKWQSNKKSEIKDKLKKLEAWLKSKNNNKVYFQYKETLLQIDYIKKKKTDGFTYDLQTGLEREFYFARLVFRNNDGMKRFATLFDKNELIIPELTTKPTKFKLYESNLAPMLRCFHIRKISGCSWVSTDKYNKIKKANKESYCNIEINVDWEQLNPIEKDCNAPLRIASFDIECYSHDGQFPQPYRKLDPIIQIGITYTKLGSSEPYRKWIACLDSTDPIDSIEVVSCETESDLMDAWINEINENDCDIITGYNIFHFDEKYMYDRCDKILNMKSSAGYISKLKDKCCNFKEFKLASSALGENFLKYWDTPGRVHIDLMKDVQKTFNLPNYKLDFVASNFIRGEIKKFIKHDNNVFELDCVVVDDINVNDYIHIEVIKGFVSDDIGDKYLVFKIDKENKKIFVNGDDILDAELEISKHGGKIFWSQAKDDVGPKEIFAYQMQGPKERAIVAKYCIKDCSLVNLLINKLEVVTKNMEMANVCYVPLSYLFTRGQGIKLFSLCLKEFREQGYIFPVIKVKKDADGNLEKEDSYEGAIVFDPVPQIDYEANTTKDYASLYPSAIMHKNMSHETEVTDPDYDNLEGITYYNSSFKESDGSTKYVRFAKIGNKLGVIPTILSNLLKERKLVKKLMKNEKNPFKYKILDAKQLAVKITANSLYGQLGAGTSPVANRNIAACTTSTGREMLLFAKKYDEEILPWIINGLKDAYENNDIDRANKIIDMELKNKDENFIERLKNYCSNTIKNYTLQPVIRYGDSVASYTPVYVLHNNSIITCTIEELANKYGKGLWTKCIDKVTNELEEGRQNKETCELEGVECWTDKGWTKLNRIIRHILAPTKKMIRVLTHTGLVDVTDDHSLLLPDGKEISPKECKVGTELLHYNLPIINNEVNYTESEAKIMGFFFGDGSCGNYNCPSGKKSSWALNNASPDILNKYLGLCKEVYPKFEWHIMDTMVSSHVCKISPKCKDYGSIVDFVRDYRGKMYFKNSKIIPNEILNSNEKIRRAFWEGMYDADGDKDAHGYVRIDQKNQISAANIQLLASSLGWKTSINTRSDKPNVYRITMTKQTQRKNPNMIKKIHPIDYEGYVYDLTTENHHFAAGVGRLIVHNTDSVFACFRFKEQKEELNRDDSIILLNKIIRFGEELLKPFFLPNDRELFSKYYNQYYQEVSDLILPMYPICLPEPNHNKIILPVEERVKQCIKEYLYENYFSWLWTLQEIVNKSFDNMDIKLLNWANYLLSKFRFTYNDLIDNRKEEVLNPLINYLEKIYDASDNLFIWHKSNENEVNTFVNLLENTFVGELIKTKSELIKIVKEFLDMNLKEEWIHAELLHNSKETHEKKKLKREKKYNDKTLNELLVIFIQNKLKLNFDKYKIDHYNKIRSFIKDELKDYIVQPWWDIQDDNNKIYKIKIYNGSEPIIDKRTLDYSMELGELSGELVKSRLPFPHDLEYEKTFWPFMILTKKRYVGNKYEFDPNKYKQDFMGIVLKRRDNAPIVKEFCSGIINLLINHRDPEGAKVFIEKSLHDMFEGKYDIKYFLQSRTLKLKESYKDWTKIAHVYLAEKIAEREGSKPESGNRIEFAVVVRDNPDNKKLLQGDMIETPAYIKQNNIPINYMFYMENQIMKPALQFLKLVDKNAEEIFIKIKEKYSKPKPAKVTKKKSSKKTVKVTEHDLLISDTETTNEKPKKTKKVKEPVTDKPKKKSSKKIKETNEEPVSEKPKKKSSKKIKETNEESVAEIINEEPVTEKPKKKNSKKIKETNEEPVTDKPKKKSSKKIKEPNEEPVTETNEEPVTEKPKKTKKIKEPITETNAEPITETNAEPITETNEEPVTVKPKKSKKNKQITEIEI